MAREPNPIRRFKLKQALTYPQLAKRLGISEDYAKKLGAGLVTSTSVSMAKHLEFITDGEISFHELMRWAADNCEAAA